MKLLRDLQEKEIERIGESKKLKIDLRIVAATHRDLRSLWLRADSGRTSTTG